MHTKSAAGYRTDIDVLRALAVTLVILYHVGFTSLSGGFVGVDVFFVISGYLITNVLVSDIEKDRFSFAAFYNRRLWRLLPALFFVVAVTFIVGAILFSPQHFKNLSRSTVFSFFGAANFDFWLQSGYFDADAIKKPLLHIWSLAVEIQFYAIWPMVVFLCFMKSRSRSRLVIVTVAALACSFGAAIYTMQVDQTAAFFMMPFRLWEFCAGGLVFLTHKKITGVKADAIYALGIFAVLWAALTYTDDTPFPGVTALAPVLGAALMLYGGAGRLASAFQNRATIYLGNISYSVYLVHWPLIVFYVLKNQEISASSRIGLVVVSIILGALSYHLVENRFRKPRSLSVPRMALAFSIFIAFIAGAASATITNGWIWRMPVGLQRAYAMDKSASDKYTFENVRKFEKKFFANNGKKKILIIGDSQSGDLSNIIVEAGLSDNFDIVSRVVINRCGVPYPSRDINEDYWNKVNPNTIKDPSFISRCENELSRVHDTTLLEDTDIVVIASLWRSYTFSYAQKIVDEINHRSKGPVYLVGAKRMHDGSLELMEAHGSLDGISAYARKTAEGYAINDFLRTLKGVTFIDIMDSFCTNKECQVFTDKDYPMFTDKDHFTKEAVISLVNNGIAKQLPFLYN